MQKVGFFCAASDFFKVHLKLTKNGIFHSAYENFLTYGNYTYSFIVIVIGSAKWKCIANAGIFKQLCAMNLGLFRGKLFISK